MNDPTPPQYPYTGADRLEERQPYRYSAYGGQGFLRSFSKSRDHLEETLSAAGAQLCGEFSDWDKLSRDAAALRPEARDELEQNIQGVRMAWEVESAAQDTHTAEILDQILGPILQARIPLRDRADAMAWAHAVVLRLLERFEAFGCVHALYDREWHRTLSTPNHSDVIVRLAVSAAWLGWGEVLVDPSSSLSHLNVLLKLIDLIDAGVHHGDWKLSPWERDAALASIEMERRLVRHWRRTREARP